MDQIFLTPTNDSENKIRITIEHILTYYKTDKTYIHLVGFKNCYDENYLAVQETPEDIDRLISLVKGINDFNQNRRINDASVKTFANYIAYLVTAKKGLVSFNEGVSHTDLTNEISKAFDSN